ncbi:MAG TPA: tRNA pseudouridine(38-40) synthase TruA [Blastocatellia bacterium]|nr:tRNA pseudouridine(38-40) synthase TruA [Blastocatellia bacterium]
MFSYKLVIEYEGTRYYGWQEQKNARTIAGEIRKAAEEFFEKPVEILGAGRTDAGVHALGQVARLKTIQRVKPLELQRALNDRLPADISVLRTAEAHPDFDPRRDAVRRYYIYQISLRRTAFAKRYVWWVKDRLNVDLMNEACSLVNGRHDFARFCDKRAEERSTLVAVERAELASDGDLLLFRIGASHFLWKMVRRIVGSLVEVGRRNLSVEEFRRLLDPRAAAASSKQFQSAAHTAPPSGLFLERVLYNGSQSMPALSAVFPVGSNKF